MCHSEERSDDYAVDENLYKVINVKSMYYVYMLTNWNNKVLYTGVTNDLERRIYEHKNKSNDGFTKRYRVYKLVYFDSTDDVRSAIEREKQIKGWSRQKKNVLVESINPEWNDLSDGWNK